MFAPLICYCKHGCCTPNEMYGLHLVPEYDEWDCIECDCHYTEYEGDDYGIGPEDLWGD